MERIFLIGYMGAGKTTLGKALAKKLHLSFIDLDWYIEERFHKTINEIFALKGEAGFRELEQKMLHEVGEFEDVIVSTGGGTPCFFDNIAFMNAHGKTVFLETNMEVLFQRLSVARHSRPILKEKTDEELRTFITESLAQRLPFYQQATYVFNADTLDNCRQIETSVIHLASMLGV